jgi:hypothetical protein
VEKRVSRRFSRKWNLCGPNYFTKWADAIKWLRPVELKVLDTCLKLPKLSYFKYTLNAENYLNTHKNCGQQIPVLQCDKTGYVQWNSVHLRYLSKGAKDVKF